MVPFPLDNALLLIKPRNQCNHTTVVVVYIEWLGDMKHSSMAGSRREEILMKITGNGFNHCMK